jgi:hypothetical protein
MGLNSGCGVYRGALAEPGAAARQGSSPGPSRSATSASLGLALLDVRVSAKTEEPENEEHDNHKADDIDNSIHDPVSFVCTGHSSHRKCFRSRGRKTIWLPPAAWNISMQKGELAHSASILDPYGPYPRMRC